jgi:hypothetical protein
MAGTVIADNLQAASTSTLVIKNGVASTPPTIQDSAGTEIGTFCRAWVNFNGTGTVAIRASFNVTSITDNGEGDYTVNFTTAMPDANYSMVGSAMRSNTNIACVSIRGNATYSNSITTTSVRIDVRENTNSLIDPIAACIAVFR